MSQKIVQYVNCGMQIIYPDVLLHLVALCSIEASIPFWLS